MVLLPIKNYPRSENLILASLLFLRALFLLPIALFLLEMYLLPLPLLYLTIY